MFEFVGKLMGIALRNKEYMNLCLPPLVWKGIAGQVVPPPLLLPVVHGRVLDASCRRRHGTTCARLTPQLARPWTTFAELARRSVVARLGAPHLGRLALLVGVPPQAATEETFDDMVDGVFTVETADGRTVPLMPGSRFAGCCCSTLSSSCHLCASDPAAAADGERMQVTWENRMEFASLTEA
jgi:hypothetical protein